MDISALQQWLAEPRTALVAAVTQGVHEHVDTLRKRKVDFYGYALHAFEPYQIQINGALANTEANIKVPPTDPQYSYYRYCVDEWPHWDHDGFVAANALLAQERERLAAMHPKEPGDYDSDEFEVAHGNVLLDAMVCGLEAAKAGGVFGEADPYMVVWFSDSWHPMMAESVRRLNPAAVATEVIRELGLDGP